jgi:hypothetical protein
VLLKIFEHDVFMANGARLSSGSTGLQMFFKLTKRPVILTVFAVLRSS